MCFFIVSFGTVQLLLLWGMALPGLNMFDTGPAYAKYEARYTANIDPILKLRNYEATPDV